MIIGKRGIFVNTMDTANKVAECAKQVYKECKMEANGRYLSWEHCHKVFKEARKQKSPNKDYLCLHLAFYLASWGMYRGSSFLLANNYLVHRPVVELLLKSKYDSLLDVNCAAYQDEDTLDMCWELSEAIGKEYSKARCAVKGDTVDNNVSGTLLSKVLLGTMGCVPAFDRYFIAGVKNCNNDFSLKRGIGIYSKESLRSIADFYVKNNTLLEDARNGMKTTDGNDYPQMKMLDMGFFQIGALLELKKYYEVVYKQITVAYYREYNNGAKTLSVALGYPWGMKKELEELGINRCLKDEEAEVKFFELENLQNASLEMVPLKT